MYYRYQKYLCEITDDFVFLWNGVTCFVQKIKSEKASGKQKERGRFACDICGKHYSSTSNLNQHKQIHTGQYKYHCELCRKGFNATTHFRDHMRAHEGLKYHCEYCSKPFMDKKRLKYHLSVHTGECRFTCDICQKGFNEKHMYKKHNESHSL